MTAVESQYKAPNQWTHGHFTRSQVLEVLWDFSFSYPLALICFTEVSKELPPLHRVLTRAYHPCNGPVWSPVDCRQLITLENRVLQDWRADTTLK